MEQKGESEALSWLKAFILALIVVFITQYFFFVPVTVYGESMFPTFEDQDKLIVSKTSSIDRFDNIVFIAPDVEDENIHYIKRVIGLPGDKIEMKDDILYINGKSYEEDYVNKENVDTTDGKVNYDFTLKELTGESTVPEDCYFVLGDNRQRSNDSREFGFIHKDSVIGEVKFRFYPFKHMGKF